MKALDSVILCFALLASFGCNASGSSTETPSTSTIQASQTPTNLMANTPSPEPTDPIEPTPVSTIEVILGDYEEIEHGGFRYPYLPDYWHTYRPGSVTLASEDQMVYITMGIVPMLPDQTLGDSLRAFMFSMSHDISNFDASEYYPLSVGNVEGLAADIEGSLFGRPSIGRIAMASHYEERVIVIFAFAAEARWRTEGETLFNALLTRVEFFEPTPMEGFCPISSDSSYGYTEDNSIGVGRGDTLVGPSLERAYLDNLVGPGGQPVAYSRIGSLQTDDTILDIYEVKIVETSRTVRLYLDLYNLDQFMIPQGFYCAWSMQQ